MAYYMIQRQEPYREAGADFFDRLQPEDTVRRLIKQAGTTRLPRNPTESSNQRYALTMTVIFTSIVHAPQGTMRHENGS
jgi:2-methylisocitrate lyase-like PEP mutase family enzyme